DLFLPRGQFTHLGADHIGRQAVAGHLGVIALVSDESFDLAMGRRDYFELAVQTLLRFARRVAPLGG
ncbi:MAG: hypothetical protein JJU24_02700, partial [Natronohydrobacter sp.]|nr:hypothetical protein [Natronohydrobacter sp.]